MEAQTDPVELRVQLSEARTDTKFAQLMADMRERDARTDAKFAEVLGEIRALEGRTDKKFAEVIGELRALSGRVDHVEKVTAGVKTTVLGTGIGVVAVLVGILSYGQTWFGLGISNRETIKAIVAEYVEQQHPLPVAPQGR